MVDVRGALLGLRWVHSLHVGSMTLTTPPPFERGRGYDVKHGIVY
jgi:hypothetical protein